MSAHPSWCCCKSCLRLEIAEERALRDLDDDPAVEAELLPIWRITEDADDPLALHRYDIEGWMP